MRNLTPALAVLAVGLAFPSLAGAQYYGGPGGSWFQPTFSSTLEEGVQRGYADIVRSRGMANLMNSQAAKEYELARREYLDNRLKATQTYFEMRRYNQEARAAERSSPLSMEQYVRLARQQAPARLSVSQLDPFTGMISWPAALQRKEYAELVNRIDTLFAARAKGTVLAHGEIQTACDELLERLKADVNKFKSNDYIQAKGFVQSLSYESTLAHTTGA
jgi:hypothetical protein